jgi:predicted XRE-type DNA-binding protein
VLDDPIPALKRQLADAILEVAAQTNMHVAASVLGIDTARMSDLRRGRIERFSVERLIRLLAMVDRRVELTIAVVGRTEVPWFGVLRARYAARHGARPCMEPQGGGPVRDVLAGSGKNTRGQPIRL